MVTKEDIEKLSALARISLYEEEKESLVKDIDSILAYVGQIQSLKLDTKGIASPVFNVFREDINPHEPEINTEAILKLAPHREGDLIKVKKILGGQ
jgi:aspartyl-tRNA(Asn)/glutamyl-tRNA(Gln) amidotransferase subunit C